MNVKFLKTVLNNWVSLSFDIWENTRLPLVHEWKKSLCCSLHIFPASGIFQNSCKESFVPALQSSLQPFCSEKIYFFHGLTIIHPITTSRKKLYFNLKSRLHGRFILYNKGNDFICRLKPLNNITVMHIYFLDSKRNKTYEGLSWIFSNNI